MNIIELISELEKLKELHGDNCEVVMDDSSGYEYTIDDITVESNSLGSSIVILK